MKRIVFTCGDVNGIGPEIAVKAFKKIFKSKNTNQIIFVCPKNVFEHYYELTAATFKYNTIDSHSLSTSDLNLVALPDIKIKFGYPTKLSGKIAYQSIMNSLDLIDSDRTNLQKSF